MDEQTARAILLVPLSPYHPSALQNLSEPAELKNTILRERWEENAWNSGVLESFYFWEKEDFISIIVCDRRRGHMDRLRHSSLPRLQLQ